MVKKISALYSVFVGVSVLGMWSMIILTGGIKEGPIEIFFHLTSEFLMAILLLIGGIGLFMDKAYGKKVFLVSNGMVIYSVLNAAGYYGQQGSYPMAGMFTVLFMISAVLLILQPKSL